MALVRVPVANTVGKTVRINSDATVGATIGQDLRLPNGTVPSLTELAAALAAEAVAAEQTRSFRQLIDSIAPSQVPVGAVTQHEAALTILESQITDGTILARVAGNESVTGDWVFSGLMTIPVATVTAHQSALTILESQITDGSILARVAANETISGLYTFEGSQITKFKGTAPRIRIIETGGTFNEGAWQMLANTDQFEFSTLADDETGGATIFITSRTDTVVDLTQFFSPISWTGGSSANANTAFGWGDHAGAGYLTSIPTHTGDVTGDTALTAAAAMISGKALVTAVATDMVLVWDATDSALKRVDANDFLSGGSVSMAQLSARIIGAM